jgi:hypothetical protein
MSKETALQPYFCCGVRYWREAAFDDDAEVVALMEFQGPSECYVCDGLLVDFAITEDMHNYYDGEYPEMVVDLVVRMGLMPGRAREILSERYAAAAEAEASPPPADMEECDFAGCVEPAAAVRPRLGIALCAEHTEDFQLAREAHAERSAS